MYYPYYSNKQSCTYCNTKTKRESIATPFSARGNKMNYEELYKKITEINFKELAYGKRNVLNDTKKNFARYTVLYEKFDESKMGR